MTARHHRQLLLPEVGLAGQQRLAGARVLVVGAGGLGSPVVLYLAAAGVGTLGVWDPDVVDESNLHRQLLHDTASVGEPKVASAARRIAALDPGIVVEARAEALAAPHAREVVAAYDVVVDGSDNFATRYAVSDACAAAGVPLVHGSVLRWEGQATVLVADGAPCYRCLFPEPPEPGSVPGCAEAGVLGALAGIVGTVQATETLKLLLGAGDTLAGRLLVIDGLRMRFTTVRVERDPGCAGCGSMSGAGRDSPIAGRTVESAPACRPPSADAAPLHRAPANGSASDATDDRRPTTNPLPVDPHAPVTAPALADRLRQADPPALLDVREPWEHAIAHVEGARLVPLATLPAAADTLDPARELVVLCHHGVRSAMAADFLRRRGFRSVRNLEGGIDAWSAEVDAAVPRY